MLLDRVGPSGARLAFEFGGDVMLGRRYQAPGRPGTAEAQNSSQARAVVEDLAPISSSADLTVVNVETVVGDLPPDEAAAGKRFLIQSPPQIVDALQELGVDAVTLGNNHANDWGDPGVISTLGVLGPSGIAYAGAGLTPDNATRGMMLPAGDQMVGLVSATTVDGDFVNDQLPTAGDARPAATPAGEEWLSTLVRSVEMPFGVERSNRWGHIELDVDPATFAPIDGDPVDAVLVTFTAPQSLYLAYTFDNVGLMEWRAAPTTDVPIWVAADALRSARETTAIVTAAGCPAG